MRSIQGSLLARNSLLNFIGKIIPLLIGVVTIPFIVRGLGTDRFGILALSWVFLEYFSLFNLGLGRATTKFVAEYLGRGDIQKLPPLVWTSVILLVLLGVFGCLVFGAVIPLLVNKVFNIAPALIGEARGALYFTAVSLPVVLASAALSGVLEAGQRFDLVNFVAVPSSALIFLLPAIAVPFGLHLPAIVALMVLVRLIASFAYLLLCMKAFRILKQAFFIDLRLVRSLLSYGKWITVSNIVGPVLTYLDRFLIGSLLTMAAVTYYTAPYELVTRLWIVPGSLVATLFPAFSAFDAIGARKELGRLYGRSIKFLLLTMGPIVLVLVLFAGNILKLWLGNDFAYRSSLVLQILAVGVLTNSLAQVPYSFLQGLGRPDITAKFHLAELPLYIGLMWILVNNMGIAGAAIAWTLRVGLDALLLFGVSWKLHRMSLRVLLENGLAQGVGALSVLTVTALLMMKLLAEAFLAQVAVTAVLVALFAVVAWLYAFDNTDRAHIRSAITQLSGVIRVIK